MDRPQPPMCAQGALGAGVLGKALPSRTRRVKLTNVENGFNTHVSLGEPQQVPQGYRSALSCWLPSHRGASVDLDKGELARHRDWVFSFICAPCQGPQGPSRRCIRGGTWARCQWPGVGEDSEGKQGDGDSH